MRRVAIALFFAGCGSDPSAAPRSDPPRDPPPDAASGSDAGSDVGSGSDAGLVADAASAWRGYGVLSINLHCFKNDGTSFATSDARFAAIADFVKREDVGVILAQEACVRGGEHAAKIISEKLGAPWTYRWQRAHVAWQGTPDEADEGVAVIARGDLAALPSSDERVVYRAQSALARVMIGAQLPAALGGLRVFSVHLDHADAPVRAAQARETASVALADTDPSFGALVGGDFNDRPGGDAHAAMGAAGFRDLSASLATSRIDHVFMHRGARAALAPASARVVFDGSASSPRVSDHPGVLVRVAPAEGEAVVVTRVIGRVTAAPPAFFALRGDTAPLGWDRGWTGRERGNEWRFVLTEMGAATFKLKLLKDDTVWQTGPDIVGQRGQDMAVTPSF